MWVVVKVEATVWNYGENYASSMDEAPKLFTNYDKAVDAFVEAIKEQKGIISGFEKNELENAIASKEWVDDFEGLCVFLKECEVDQ